VDLTFPRVEMQVFANVAVLYSTLRVESVRDGKRAVAWVAASPLKQ